jgi:hypothetical protein
MMGSAANVRSFLAKLEEASREGASASTRMVWSLRAERQPELEGDECTAAGVLV